MPEFLQNFQLGVPELSAGALFFVFFFGTFVSEDAACLAAGAAAAAGRINFAIALTACFLGIFVGDMLLYAAGRALGDRVFDNRIVRRIVSVETRSKASNWLEENGAAAVFLSRFVSGLRLPTYLAAGAVRTDFRKFAGYFLLASAIWTPILVGGAAFSQAVIFPQNAIFGLIAAFVLIRFVTKYTSWKKRRLIVGRVKRFVNWEFWPVQVFYAPVVLYIVFLALKHRSLTVFTAANPGIAGGGFKGESKNDIYNRLRSPGSADRFLLAHTMLSCGDAADYRLRKARKFILDHNLSFPLVLKPDAGERGKGVRVVHSITELNNGIAEADADLILQEHAAGDEASIFYYRYPSEPQGHIFSITEKRFPEIEGDGKKTIDELILTDGRAVCLAEKYFEQNRERLHDVPAAGETVSLIDIGTHSRGAIFLDGDRLMTDLLGLKIDEICRGFDGFYFGRFDIRVPTFGDLQNGADFKIIELNGVTSESTNIYDPRYSLADAYRILFRQWRIAFEIGVENVKLGAAQTGISDLARMTFGLQLDKDLPPHTAARN